MLWGDNGIRTRYKKITFNSLWPISSSLRDGLSTVRSFESGDRTPIANNIAAMRQTIEAAGVELVDEEGEAVGIRRKQDAPTR